MRCIIVLLLGIGLAMPATAQNFEKGEEAYVREQDVRALIDVGVRTLSEALGWQEGVPDVEVQILRNGTAEWLTARTDSTGTAVFTDLLAGLYRVFGGRTLTEAEAASIDQPIRAFGDGRTLKVFLETDLELVLLADRPGSLVFSEFGSAWYLAGRYFEVYNNADTTIFLDGKMFGSTWVIGQELDWMPCTTSLQWRSDPAGVAARFVLQFPGSGTEHPIPPGEVRTVAVSAIDHTPVHPTMLDLSGADFEIGGALLRYGIGICFPHIPSIPQVVGALMAELWCGSYNGRNSSPRSTVSRPAAPGGCHTARSRSTCGSSSCGIHTSTDRVSGSTIQYAGMCTS